MFSHGLLVVAICLSGGCASLGALNAKDAGFHRIKSRRMIWQQSRLPLDCWFHPNVSTKSRRLVGVVVKRINRVVGRRIISPCAPWQLDWPTKPPSGAIMIKISDGDPEDPVFDTDTAGSTAYFGNTVEPLVGIQIYAKASYSTKYAMWLHEFGHAMGLEHDDLQNSIMYPVLKDPKARLTPRDIARLREAYGRK